MTVNTTRTPTRPMITEASLWAKIKHYKKQASEIEKYLQKSPKEWGRFQNEFNAEINNVFREIMNFEKECLINNEEEKLYKLKRIFMERIRGPFERGEYIQWILKKPYGYAGDFKIIEDVYQNNPSSVGFDRLFDNYTMMSAISIAVRNRKNDFKRMITDYVSSKQNCPIRIMDLASGPCREILEMLTENKSLYKHVIFDCYDSDINSIKYSQKRLSNYKNINFFEENAARIAFRKDINALIDKKYDIIYSTGLFDYFEEKIAFRLIQNLKKLLTPHGVLIISDVRDKYSNPSLHFMEWVGEWPLVYRNDDDFRKIFINAGFKKEAIKPDYEQQGILQYISATNKKN